MRSMSLQLATAIADMAADLSNKILLNLSMLATVTPAIELEVRTQVFAQTLTRCTKEMETRINGHFA